MKKLIIAAVVIGGLLAGAMPVLAQVGDPLSLAASGVLIPYLTEAGTVATIEIASPVGPEIGETTNVHMIFFGATCARTGDSVELPLTTNDIAFQQISSTNGGPVLAGTNGVVAIAHDEPTGFGLAPLTDPIHARIYLFNATDGRSRIIEPIILDSAEWPGPPHTWSPLRTGATFFAPQQTSTVQSLLFLVCPRATIQSASGAGVFPTDLGFPAISPPFPPGTSSGAGSIQARIYNANEEFKRDASTPCDCLSQVSVAALSTFYSTPDAADGTYTELVSPTPFTGYRNVFTVGSPLNNFFGRLSNGSTTSLQGTLCIGGAETNCR